MYKSLVATKHASDSHETARFFFFSRFLGKRRQARSERGAVIHAQRGALLEKGVG